MTWASITNVLADVMSIGSPRYATVAGPCRDPKGLLRRNGLPLPLEGSTQRVPGQDGALDPNGELFNPGKYRKLAEINRIALLVALPGDQVVKSLKKPLGFGAGLSLPAVGHHRCGGPGNRAARPLKTDAANHIILHLDVERDLVAAQRVMPLRRPVGALQCAKVAWLLAVAGTPKRSITGMAQWWPARIAIPS